MRSPGAVTATHNTGEKVGKTPLKQSTQRVFPSLVTLEPNLTKCAAQQPPPCLIACSTKTSSDCKSMMPQNVEEETGAGTLIKLHRLLPATQTATQDIQEAQEQMAKLAPSCSGADCSLINCAVLSVDRGGLKTQK